MAHDGFAVDGALTQPMNIKGRECCDDHALSTSQTAPNSPWRHLVLMLNVYGKPQESMPPADAVAKQRQPAARSGITHATVRILDRPTPTSAVISWRDPTGSSYGYQIWKMRAAREEGLCAVSGAPINRGDPVFRPLDRGRHPGNASAMILATCIDEPNCWLNAILRRA